jgi:hypothetical protein
MDMKLFVLLLLVNVLLMNQTCDILSKSATIFDIITTQNNLIIYIIIIIIVI